MAEDSQDVLLLLWRQRQRGGDGLERVSADPILLELDRDLGQERGFDNPIRGTLDLLSLS